MKKWLTYLSAMFLALGLLTGCSNGADEGDISEENNTNTTVSTNESSGKEDLAEDEVRITISIDNGKESVAEEVVQVEEGDILMDVLKDTFYVEEDGGFITSIERVENDDEEGKYWMFFVNGEMAEVGAGDYELTGGEDIDFDLQAME